MKMACIAPRIFLNLAKCLDFFFTFRPIRSIHSFNSFTLAQFIRNKKIEGSENWALGILLNWTKST